jgi:hypothetical protein
MTISHNVLEDISEYAIRMDWDVAFDGRSKGNRHLHRVNRIVIYRDAQEGGKTDISIAGGWLHDLGLVKGNKGHCFAGAELAERYLAGLGIDAEDISQVTHCIEAHDGEVRARTVEAMIIHDADTIDKMGPFGYIRHVWKLSLVEDFTPSQLVKVVGNHISERKSMLYFPSSKDIVKDFDRTLEAFLSDGETAEEVTRVIADRAFQGIPSERVAEMIIENSTVDENFQDSVRSQMAIDYLP